MKKRVFIVALIFSVIMLGTMVYVNFHDDEQITAELMDKQGHIVGTATFSTHKEGVQIDLHANLSEGMHGFHIHEHGVCEPPDFVTAGGHYNPSKQLHGNHAGDLPNIVGNDRGYTKISIITDRISLKKGKWNSIIEENGTSIMVHQYGDDGKTDPSGNSGPRMACGVIKK
ncbi:superoxide dismutase family protein [Longirhabdus pacifica]|uniref:superoxide dismutase family protein n=1 Tax=Longirhabdus pacifica TaxID=2305227 RepID=UPI0013E8BBEF|nr:superoxide dismutase family protein [Longirhabdus pacifica]